MSTKNKNIIIKFDCGNEQTVNNITKIVGLVRARYFVPIINYLNLEANPRSSKTGAVTDAIQETIEKSPELFPFMTKGVLLAASNYERLERDRIKIMPEDDDIEGILDGGHNTLAIGLYILKQALEFNGESLPRGQKTWNEFKNLWNEKIDTINIYLDEIQKDKEQSNISFLVPVELLVPKNPSNDDCVLSFKNTLLEICEARNNNVELPLTAKNNQKGYFEEIKSFMENHNKNIANKIEWKPNDGGTIKAQDIIALSWIPLRLIDPVRDENNMDRQIEPISPNKIYSSKGSCMKQFEKLMSSPDVTIESDDNYKRELRNDEVKSALKITTEIPELYDYIYEKFPTYYNSSGGIFGRINTVKKLNTKRKLKTTPFSGKEIETLSPDGFIVPLVYGLQSLMIKKEYNGKTIIDWDVPPMPFLVDNLEKIVANYSGILSICEYDPQKVGKSPQSYTQALNAFKMAKAGIL